MSVHPPRRWILRAAIVCAALGIAIAIVFHAPDSKHTIPENRERIQARLLTDGVGAEVTREVERATRPKKAAFALLDDGRHRLGFLLIDDPEHFYQLDHGLNAGQFAVLKSGVFQKPPDPFARTISVYRSLAKRAMNYRATGEDRLVVLLCPTSEWSELNFEVRDYNPGPLPGELESRRGAEF